MEATRSTSLNRHVIVLTIVTVVFLPPSFVAVSRCSLQTLDHQIKTLGADTQIDSSEYSSFSERRRQHNLRNHDSNLVSHQLSCGDSSRHYRGAMEVFSEGYEVGRRTCLSDREGESVKLSPKFRRGEGYVSPRIRVLGHQHLVMA